MCLILFAYRTSPGYPLIVSANRDEFHSRETAQADYWVDTDQILAGRDLVAGGTWLGCTTSGRFAALTNFSSPGDEPSAASRGALVQAFLAGSASAEHFAHDIVGPDYAGFNLLLFDGTHLVYTSNRGTTEVLNPGFYGLSNAELSAQWPKCVSGASQLASITDREHTAEELISLMADQNVPPDDELPHRGRPVEMERRAAACFIVGDEYGTRASTIVYLGDNHTHFVEQSYARGGLRGDRVDFEFSHSNQS